MSLINRCSFAWLHSIVGNKSIEDRFRFVNFYVTQRTIRPFLPSLCAKVSTLPDIFLSQGSIRTSLVKVAWASDHCKLFTSITDSYWTVANTSFGILPNREEWYNNKTGEYILVVFYVVFTYRNKMKAGGERASKRIYIIASLQSVVNRIALSFIHVLTKHHFKKVQRLRYCKRVVSVSDSIPVFGSPYRTTPMPLLTSTPFILYNKIREYKRVICSLFHVVRQKLHKQ